MTNFWAPLFEVVGIIILIWLLGLTSHIFWGIFLNGWKFYNKTSLNEKKIKNDK